VPAPVSEFHGLLGVLLRWIFVVEVQGEVRRLARRTVKKGSKKFSLRSKDLRLNDDEGLEKKISALQNGSILHYIGR
jgi:hypothetical protein